MASKKNEIPDVPSIVQMESLESAAACLAMILGYYGRWISLEQARTDCGISRDGSRAANILRAARTYGLDAKACEFDSEEIKKQTLPCIIYWNSNRYVVLKGFNEKWAFVNDPALGMVRVPLPEFDRSYTGAAILFKKGESFKPAGKPFGMGDFAKTQMLRMMGPVILMAVAALLISFSGLSNTAFARVFLDRVLSGADQAWLMPLIGLMALVAFLQCVAIGINTVSVIRIQGKVAVEANSSFIWHLLRLPVSFYEQRDIGDLQQRQSENEVIAYTFISEIAPVLLNAALAVVYYFVMLAYSPLLTLIGMVAVVLNLAVARITLARRVNNARVLARDKGRLYASTLMGLDQIEGIKASGAEDGFFEQWSGTQAILVAFRARLAFGGQYIGTLPSTFAQLVNVAVLAVGVWLIMQQEFTPGMLLAFQGLFSGLVAPVSSLLSMGVNVQRMRSSVERIEDVMSSATDVKEDALYMPLASSGEKDAALSTSSPDALRATAALEKLEGAVDIDSVTFGYSPTERPFIRDFNMHVKPGEQVAIVGSSGAGKSTIARLIAGLYKPDNGDVLFDGKPMAEIPLPVLRSSLAVVEQDIVFFEGSVLDNLRIWDDTVSPETVFEVAHDTGVHGIVMSRLGGYDQKILTAGSNFSSGEKQLLEITRALVQDPSIIVLDEATSSLDAESEKKVLDAIRAKGISCIMITHRMSAIHACDKVVMMEDGCVVGQGAHEDLVACCDAYAQFAQAEEEDWL